MNFDRINLSRERGGPGLVSCEGCINSEEQCWMGRAEQTWEKAARSSEEVWSDRCGNSKKKGK